MVLSASRVICLPGAARRLITFLASPRKVIPPARSVPAGRSVLRTGRGEKRRRPPSTAPTGYPALLVKPGGCATRAFALRQCSPTAPGLPVLLGGGPRGVWRKLTFVSWINSSNREPPPISPLRRFGLAGGLGGVGCALFEFRSRARFVCPARASCADAQFACQSEGTRRAARWGALFFRLLSFGQAQRK